MVSLQAKTKNRFNQLLLGTFLVCSACGSSAVQAGGDGDGGGGGADAMLDGDGAPIVIDAGVPDAFVDPCADGETVCYYVAPDGDDGAAGTIDAPFATLAHAWTLVAPGTVVYLRGGEYNLENQLFLEGKSGTEGNMIRVWAFPGERPILNAGPNYTVDPGFGEYVGIMMTGDYIHLKGFEITGYTQRDHFVASGMRIRFSNHNIFENLDVHHNGHGMRLEDNSTGNLFLNCDFHHNADPLTDYGNADGLGINYIPQGAVNTVRGCRAWENSDDGFDFFAGEGHVIAENNWSWRNGYIPDTDTPGGNGEGFKLGVSGKNGDTFLRTIRGNLAFNNRLSGIHQEEGDCRMRIYNNVAFGNLDMGFNFDYLNRAHDVHNNIAYRNENAQAHVSPNTTSSHNAFGGNPDGISGDGWLDLVSDADFLSTDATGVDGPRQADGSLPVLDFLRLAPGSDLINAGTDVGLPFDGTAPDIGAYERE